MKIGSHLGPYEIISVLGSGGMGEVYRARDPRLKRDVAIKILDDDGMLDPAKNLRFQREAQAASALNHPNILVIYDIGIDNGRSFIVSELLDGQTLRQLIQKKSISIKRSLEIAIDIATGLATAHEAGIIHRDLKPENVMLTKEGCAKILDFGLAKFLNLEAVEQETKTISTELTQSGVIHGTISYMSPEQAHGLDLDYRSDQFSFGVLLYEMLSGKRPFLKPTAIETLNAVIKEDPEPISTDIPPPIRWVVERCLQKNPSDRYGSTQDITKDLKNIRTHFSEFISIKPREKEVSKWKISKVLNFVFIGLILGLAIILFLLATKEPKSSPPPDYLRLTYRRGPIYSARFAPDGQTVVYSASFDGNPVDLYVSRKNGLETRSLGIANADILSISKSGNMLILLRDKDVMAQVSLSGGSPREIAERISSADWSPDGKQISVSTSGFGGSRIEFPHGKIIYRSMKNLNLVRVSPKGDAIAFREYMHGDHGVVRIVDLNGKTIAASQEMWPNGLSWSPQGDKVWFTSGPTEAGRGAYLYTLDLSGTQKLAERFAGAPRIRDIHRDAQMILDFVDVGSVVMSGSETEDYERNLSVLDSSCIMDFSTDARQLLIWELGEGSEGELGTTYMRNVNASPAVRLTDGSGSQFSEDGKWILAKLNATTSMLVPTAAGTVKYFTQPDMVSYAPVGFIPGGEKVILAGTDKKGSTHLFIQEAKGGEPSRIDASIVSNPFYLHKAISPDGKLIAAENRDGIICVFDLSTGKHTPLRGVKKGEQPIHWTKDGSSILVFEPWKVPAEVYKINISLQERIHYKTLKPADLAGVEGIWLISFADDEKAYAYTFSRSFSTLHLVEGYAR